MDLMDLSDCEFYELTQEQKTEFAERYLCKFWKDRYRKNQSDGFAIMELERIWRESRGVRQRSSF